MEIIMTCFDRNQEIADLWRHFKNGHNLLMLAPRRIGKTVLLNHLSRTAAENGFRAILLDVEGFREEKAFFRACCSAIQEELSTGTKVLTAFTDRLNQLLRGSAAGGDWRQWLVQTDWQEFADHLFAHLDAHNEDAPWLVLVDELPVFINALQEKGGPEAISGFLYWLRGIRQKYRRIRWLYTGSIGLDTVARRIKVEGSLNDLESFTLKPFSEATAYAFLADIARRRGFSLEKNAAEAILQRLGWLSPYYLERIAEDACAFVSAGQALTLKQAQASMDQLMELDKRLYWSSWREHLDRNFNEPERGHLYSVLETVARDQNGVDRNLLLTALNRSGEPIGEAVLRGLLDTLLADGYLSLQNGQHCRFRMNLLREWWLRYVVL
jgi:AAA+ ATPase superfamily predicted ATPase